MKVQNVVYEYYPIAKEALEYIINSRRMDRDSRQRYTHWTDLPLNEEIATEEALRRIHETYLGRISTLRRTIDRRIPELVAAENGEVWDSTSIPSTVDIFGHSVRVRTCD